jgi:hypothetical protein
MGGGQPGNHKAVSKTGLVDTPFTGLGGWPLLRYNALRSSSQFSETYWLLLNP